MSEKRIKVWVQRFADRPALVLQWTDPDTGKRKSKSAGTADAKVAETLRADLESDLNHGRHKETSRVTWERFREIFEAEYVAATAQNTQRNFAAALDLFERICNPQRLAGVTGRTISLFAAGMRKLPGRRLGSESMMPSTIHVRLQAIHTALTWAFRQKLLSEVPAFPEVRVPDTAPPVVATESFEKMLAKADDEQTRTYLLCGWLAGLRLSEALALEWENTDAAPWLDLSRNRINLPASISKSRKDQWVPLDPELRAVLEQLPRHGARVFRFVNSRGQELTVNGVSTRIGDVARKAGVRLTMKALRSGFASRYAAKVSAHVLQRLMRHANIKTTMKFYANIDDAVEAAVLGGERNRIRNRQAAPPVDAEVIADATPLRADTN